MGGVVLGYLLNTNSACNKSSRLLLQYWAVHKMLSQARLKWVVLWGGTEVKADQVHFTPAIGQIPRGSRNLARGSHCRLLQKAPLKLQLSVNSRAVEITNLPYNKPYITYTPEPQGSFQMRLEVSLLHKSSGIQPASFASWFLMTSTRNVSQKFQKEKRPLRPQQWGLLYFLSFLFMKLHFTSCSVLLGSVALSDLALAACSS